MTLECENPDFFCEIDLDADNWMLAAWTAEDTANMERLLDSCEDWSEYELWLDRESAYAFDRSGWNV